MLARWYAATRGLTPDQIESRRRRFADWSAQFGAASALALLELNACPCPLRVLRVAATTLGKMEGKARGRRPLARSRRADRAARTRRESPQVSAGYSIEAERFGHAKELPRGRVDRVDALLALWDAFPAPRASALLRNATSLLGWVLRDTGWLRHVLEEVPRPDALK